MNGLGGHICSKNSFCYYLKLPISEFTCIPQLYTNTELTIPVIVTDIISSYEFSTVLYQQKLGTGSLKITVR